MADTNAGATPRKRGRLSIAMWVIQIALAALFLFGGVMKLVPPIAELVRATGLPGPFIRFLGVAEVLGGLGLVLPGLLKIKPGLTPLAAACLVIIMIGAVVMGVMMKSAGGTLFPLATGLLLTFIAYGRWRLVPLRGNNA